GDRWTRFDAVAEGSLVASPSEPPGPRADRGDGAERAVRRTVRPGRLCLLRLRHWPVAGEPGPPGAAAALLLAARLPHPGSPALAGRRPGPAGRPARQPGGRRPGAGLHGAAGGAGLGRPGGSPGSFGSSAGPAAGGARRGVPRAALAIER